MDERMLLIGEYLKGDRAMAELCREFGVSRKTAYKWVGRYKEDGPAGLADKSRAPLSHPARLDTIVVEALLEARRAHPVAARNASSRLAPVTPPAGHTDGAGR